MRNFVKIGIVVFSFLGLIVIAPKQLYADITLRVYKKTITTEKVRAYITGVGNGLRWADTYLMQKKQPGLFCEPGNLDISTDDYINIIERELKNPSLKYNMDTNVEIILLKGLEKKFPCR